MTATENRRDYTTISVLPTTKARLGDCMPKGWDWDRIILALTEMWEKDLGKGTKTGKSPQDSQIS